MDLGAVAVVVRAVRAPGVVALVALAACKGGARRAPMATTTATSTTATATATSAATSTAWAALEAAGRPAIAPGPADELVRALALIDYAELPRALRAGFDPHDQALR